MRLAVALVVVTAVLSTSAVEQAEARRVATPAESAAMWAVVDQDSRCAQHRGVISTVRSGRYRFGSVTVADANCGNGQAILRQRRGTNIWRIVGQGSDWGARDRCAADLRRIPRAVLQDIFGARICPPALPLKRCGSVSVVTEGVQGRATVTARGVRCSFARRTVERSNRTGQRPSGWECLGSGEGLLCVRRSAGNVADLANDPEALRYVPMVRSQN